MENEHYLKYFKAQEALKKSPAGLDTRIAQIESIIKISEDLQKLQKDEEILIHKRNNLKLGNLEARVASIEDKDLQKLIEISHRVELHDIMLEQTEEINNLRSDIEEVNFNINNDDRINSLVNEWQEKLTSMCESLEKASKSVDGINVVPLNQEVQYLHREIAEDKIKKEQENVRIDLIQEQIEQIWKRYDNRMPLSQEMEMEQELFLQSLQHKYH